ncbi:diacylglycerol kinase [Rhizobium sp. KVB221]|uniref:Diacylglycerol kinase n=1 Tax=Rhizobium setariae TaxID=2801340 RepID=A0A936YTW0_9HYPH|nr:diacylglycerol kinase [Rhizobium setariae]MBL0374867.1 diacylglycerol kinase [Rhizobium setariae]
MNEPVDKKTGLAHLFAAGSYSYAGFSRALQESAFRHEILFFLAGLGIFLTVGATPAEFLGLVIIFLLTFGFEALNTAIEEVIDRVSPEMSTTGKHAKDLGSFAVFCTLAAATLYIAWVVIS